jgi:hypothetical protein
MSSPPVEGVRVIEVAAWTFVPAAWAREHSEQVPLGLMRAKIADLKGQEVIT